MQTFKKPLSQKEEEHFLALSANGNENARQILIEYNMRLVAHIAKKYSGGYDIDDLISAGTIGLIKAIDTYDKSKGSRLATYASKCIDNELLMLLRHERKRMREVSLYEPIGTDKEGNEISLIDITAGDEIDVIDVMIHDYSLSRLPECISESLTQRESQLLAKRYGLYGGRPETQKEIAASMGISRSYVSRIEKRALLKLRDSLSK